MNKKNYPALFAFVMFSWIVMSITAAAQIQSDSLDYIQTVRPVNLLSTGLNKQLNTYSLHSVFHLNKSFGGVDFGVAENYISTFTRSREKSVRDEHYFTFSGAYSLSPSFKFGYLVNNNILSDSRTIEINQASLSDVAVFGEVSPFDNFSLAPYFGYSNNRQVGESDNGFLYGAEGYLDKIGVSDFNVMTRLKFSNEDISPRKNTTRFVSLAVTNNPNPTVSNSIRAQYFSTRKDFYYKADSMTSRTFDVKNNIQSRIETYNVLQDRFNYNRFLDIFSLSLLGTVSLRTIDRNTRYKALEYATSSIFDTKINEVKVEFESVTSYSSENFTGNFRANYSERDEKHLTKNITGVNSLYYNERSDLESRKNNTAKRASLSLEGNLRMTDTDKLEFSLYQNKLRYDTPSPENYDDRDELLSIVRLRYVRALTPFFSAFMGTEGTLNHVVYVHSKRSSNNNINRILKFSSGGVYRGKYVTTLNSFEVSANYTVYDFEDINPNYRSYSFRQFTATDSSLIKMTNRISFIHYGYVKLSEQGDLKWASFSTHPTRYLEEIYSEPKFGVKYNGNLELRLGLRIYSLDTYNFKGAVKVIDSKYLSVGPSTEVILAMNNSLSLNFYGWYEFISISSGTNKQQANMSFQMNWNF